MLERQTEQEFHDFFCACFEQIKRQNKIELMLFEAGLRLAEIEETHKLITENNEN